MGRDAHPGNSESQEHSQNSWKKQAEEDIGNVKVTVSAEDNKCPAVSSDFLEHSQNSLSSGKPELDTGKANVSFGDRDGQCLVTASEFRELSPNSRVEMECSEGTQKKQHCTVSLSLFADPERILRRFYVFAEEPCQSTITTSEPCSPVFKEAQPIIISYKPTS